MLLTIIKTKQWGNTPYLTGYSPALEPILEKWFSVAKSKNGDGMVIDKRRTIALTQHYNGVIEVDTKAQAWLDAYWNTIPKRLSPHLYEHQRAAVLKALEQKSLGCFIDAGGGKTVIACEFAKHVGPVLLIVPPAIWNDAYINPGDAKGNNKGDLIEFPAYHGLAWADAINQKTKADKIAALNQRADIYAVSMYAIGEKRTGSGGPSLLQEALKIPVAGVIVDESSLIRNVERTRAKAVLACKTKTELKLALSADPCPNDVGEIWTQAEFLRPGTLGTYNTFGKLYGQKGRYGYTFPTDEHALNAVEQVKPFSILMPQSAFWKDRPKYTPLKVPVTLDEDERRAYDALEADLSIRGEGEHGTEEQIVATSAMEKDMMLRELTSGFSYSAYGATWHGDRSKLKMIQRLIAERPKEQWVIWCQWREEGQAYTDALEELGYSVSSLIRESRGDRDNLESFKSRKTQILVSHTSQASHGVRLAQARNMIFASLTYDNDAVYQAIRRIYRPPQKRDCYVYFLVAERTVDEKIWAALTEKIKWRENFERKMMEAVA